MCLDSIASQAILPDEVIVVDNNSTDRTIDVASRYPFVRVVSEDKQGIVHARGTGFDAAKSDLIGRIDADTILPNDWVARVMDFYSQPDNAGSVLTGGAAFRNMPMPRLNGRLQNALVFWLNRLALGHHIVWGSNMVIPAHVWQQVRDKVCTMPLIHEDIDLAIHLDQLNVPIVFQRQLHVSAVLRRILTDQAELWANLKWWPRTLRRHNKRTWPITVLGAGYVFLLAQFVRLGVRLRLITDPQGSNG